MKIVARFEVCATTVHSPLASMEKQFDAEVVPVAGMDFDMEGLTNELAIKHVTVSPSSNCYYVTLEDVVRRDPDACEQFIRGAVSYGWKRL
ncbi:hypothetical protein [Symbiobacterium terraclitae]|uniref:hypothetical protein n=1 Tax=Symbiobacterium terraclitae TaxID=557451 RepID=UPI0035B55B98